MAFCVHSVRADVDTSVFDEIKAQGSVVICYFSAGTREDWREDADDFPEEGLGEPLADWDGEVWVDVNNEEVRAVMAARLDTAVEKGCDGVEPDNVQVYAEILWGVDAGVNVTADEQLDYNTFLATEVRAHVFCSFVSSSREPMARREHRMRQQPTDQPTNQPQAHSRNLSIGLKNDLDHLAELEPLFDWAINESCMEYDECDGYITTFIAAGKSVFHTEYEHSDLTFCDQANAIGMSSLLKSYDLGPERCSCQDPTTNNNCALLLELGAYYEQPSSVYSSTSSSSSSAEETENESTGGALARHAGGASSWAALAVCAVAAIAVCV
ncbi:unnamed protein product [Ectocarpus sp. 12 AP-2014]